MEIRNQDKVKTAFTSHREIYRFIRMQLGLKNAPNTFQRVIDVILPKSNAGTHWAIWMMSLYSASLRVCRRTLQPCRGRPTPYQDVGVTLKLKMFLLDGLGGLLRTRNQTREVTSSRKNYRCYQLTREPQ